MRALVPGSRFGNYFGIWPRGRKGIILGFGIFTASSRFIIINVVIVTIIIIFRCHFGSRAVLVQTQRTRLLLTHRTSMSGSSTVWTCAQCQAENWMSHKWCGKCSNAWWKTSQDATGKSKSSADVAKKARAAANKAAQMTDTCEQVHVGDESEAEHSPRGQGALMIGPHSSDIANRLDKEILALRRALTDQRPLGEQFVGIQGVITRGEKRLNLALAERESAMEALQAAETKIAHFNVANGHDTSDTKHAHKFPERSQEWDALGVHGGNCCLRERSDPTTGRSHGQRKPRRRGDAYGTMDHSEKPAYERENVHRDTAPGAATAAAARLRPKLCDDIQQPPVKRCMSSIVFATANITSADPRQSTAKRSVGLNCTGRMAESEVPSSAAGFPVVAVQEGRMPSRTVLSGNTYRMHVVEGVGTTHSLGLQLWSTSVCSLQSDLSQLSLHVSCASTSRCTTNMTPSELRSSMPTLVTLALRTTISMISSTTSSVRLFKGAPRLGGDSTRRHERQSW